MRTLYLSDPDILHIESGSPLRGLASVPGDKSISHRVVIFGALAEGASHVTGWLSAGDTRASLKAIQALGIPVERHDDTTLTIHGGQFRAPASALNLVNTGTGIRLLAGIMAGQPFPVTLDGSEQLRRRPMRRVTAPLREMGAAVTDRDGLLPLHFEPSHLRGIRYELPVASAQVKSALLLAALFAEGPTTVLEPGPSRDHTERLLSAMGAGLIIAGGGVTLTPGRSLNPIALAVPGDFSSAAFLIVASTIVADSQVTLENVSINPTRTGLLDVLKSMGANIQVEETGYAGGDPVGRLMVQSAPLGEADISGETVVRMIDEFPAFMIAALCADGNVTVREARELRVKETDRISIMAGELRKMGAVILEQEDGFTIQGPQKLTGAVVNGHDDHRVAMSLAVAGLVAAGRTTVRGAGCVADSFPGFARTLAQLGVNVQ